MLRATFFQKPCHEQRDVVPSFTERRKMERHDVQPIIEIFSKIPCFTASAKLRFVAAMILASTLINLVPPSA